MRLCLAAVGFLTPGCLYQSNPSFQASSGEASSATQGSGSSTSTATTATDATDATMGMSETSLSPTATSGDSSGTDSQTDTTGLDGCGDGVAEGTEACDDMNDDQLDGCLTDCRIGPTGFELAPGDTLLFEGGTAGTEVADDCPAGEVLVGFRGSADMIVQQLQGVCGTPTLSFSGGFVVTLPETTVLPLRGIVAATPFELLCPASEAVVGFAGRAGAFVDQMVVRCAPLTVGDDGTTFTLGVGAPTALPPVGGNGGEAFNAQDCGPGQVARATDLFTGDFIDQIRLRCATISLGFRSRG